MTVQDIISKYIALRDRKDVIRREYNERVAKIAEAMNLMEAMLMDQLNNIGAESTKTEAGTAYIEHRTSATVADRDAFFAFVDQNDAWDMLESRCSKTAVEQYKNVYGELPPGLNYRVERVVNVRRPAKR